MNRDALHNYNQYLERYAEAEARALLSWLSVYSDAIPAGRAVVSIPLCRERALIEGCVASLVAAANRYPAIVIFIINNRESAADEVKTDNHETNAFLLAKMSSIVKISENISVGPVTEHLTMVLVDRMSSGQELPENQGVGLARKIGCDLGSVLITETCCSDGFIRNTDGDARVGGDFFMPIDEGPAAAVFPFIHQPKKDGVDAVLQYEKYLYYYVRGLEYAGSSYAFHTIGSTIACSALSYISCRGFPKRDAGEDFYLLNKLAKDGPVVGLDREPVVLVSRESDRVPFGTGAACRRIEGLVLSGGTYQVYHPDCFRLLKSWLEAIALALDQKNTEVAWAGFSREAANTYVRATPEVLASIDAALQLEAGLTEVLKKSQRQEILRHHARIWFDGFRTMRFLNMVRDLCFGEVPVTDVAHQF